MYKSTVRSMQRGAHLSDRDLHPVESTYHLKDPHIREDDLSYLGGRDRFVEFANEIKPTILALAKNGFKRPSQVTALLNKQGIRTPSGDFWTRRLVWFLLGEIYKDSPKRKKPDIKQISVVESPRRPTLMKYDPQVTAYLEQFSDQPKTRTIKAFTAEEVEHNRRKVNIVVEPLSDNEIKRRQDALARLASEG
ncbi:hypothetical protein L3V16_21320 [Brucella ciceri]|uniref:hypothetical protein n=1 Tax=Brucella ciceri TaxID=391287 RepID=UPI000DE52ABB|nr:hypothetical protein [Brucella ciceri]MCH6206368.1 hypothetical protein [Brucella ciceri]